jgi:hypothetical protein
MIKQENNDFFEQIKGKKIRRNDFKLGEWFRPERVLDHYCNICGEDECGNSVYYYMTKGLFDKDWSFLEDATISCAGINFSDIAATNISLDVSYPYNVSNFFPHINLALSLVKEVTKEDINPLILKDKMAMIFAEYIAGKHQEYQTQIVQLANIYQENI